MFYTFLGIILDKINTFLRINQGDYHTFLGISANTEVGQKFNTEVSCFLRKFLWSEDFFDGNYIFMREVYALPYQFQRPLDVFLCPKSLCCNELLDCIPVDAVKFCHSVY